MLVCTFLVFSVCLRYNNSVLLSIVGPLDRNLARPVSNQISYRRGIPLRKRFSLAEMAVCLLGVVSVATQAEATTITRGRELLLKHGYQIQALTFRNPGPVDVNQWFSANFTTLNVWDRETNPLLSEFPVGTPWSRTDGNNEEQIPTDPAYRDNLVSMQYYDEVLPSAPHLGTDFQSAAAAKFNTWRQKYPNTIAHANFWGEQISPLALQIFQQVAKPDMLMFDQFPDQNFGTSDRNRWYTVMQNYRTTALAGYFNPDLTNSGPLPYGQYLAHWRPNYSVPLNDESFIRLQQNASLAFGYTFLSAFIYNEPNPGASPMMFSSTGDTSPTPVFGYAAETNRQTLNLGPVLTRLVSSGIFMQPGSGMSVGGTGLTQWAAGAGTTTNYNDHLTGITPTVSQGGAADPSYNDILVGYFEPLAEDSCGCTFSDGLNFMIVNGSASGTAAASAQWYNLSFDFAGSNFDSLARLSRDTGQVELVPLTPSGGTTYSLDLNLEGGTGDLFRYWDSSDPLPGIVDLENFEWRTDGASAWESTTNWDALTVHPGDTSQTAFNEMRAIFGSVITSNRTVTLDDAVSLRAIEFDNASSSYAIGGNGSINLVASTLPVPDPTEILVTSGDHHILTDVNLATDATFHAESGTTLTLHNTLDLGGNDLTLSGPGTISLNTQITGAGNIINLAVLSAGLSAALGSGDLESSGALDFDITPYSAGQIFVGGTATLEGVVNVDFLEGAIPLGDIPLLTSSNPLELPGGMPSLSLSGASGLELALSEDGTSLLLVAAIPEPTTACLVLFGCLLMLRGRIPHKKIKMAPVACLTLAAVLSATSSAQSQQIWNLEDDWTLTSPGPGIEFGADNAWSIRAGDSSGGPTSAFVDTTENYFTPSGCTGGGCATMQYISGYANANEAVFKTYDNLQPWLSPNEVVKPADHNQDPGAGVLDAGDIGAKAGGAAADIVWKAPRNMIIDAEYVAYNVGTQLTTTGGTPGANQSQTRIHFLVRDIPATGPINPEGEPDFRLTGYSSGAGRQYTSQKIAPFAVTAGQEVYLKVNRIDPDLGGPLQPSHPDRNVIGFSKIEVRDLTNLFEWRPDFPGDWTTVANWDERVGIEAPVITDYPGDTGVATYNEHKVLFADDISSSRTISLDSSVSVRALEFDNPTSSFSVSGFGDINLVASSGSDPTEVRVTSGAHELQVDVNLATATSMDLGDDSSLELHKLVDLAGNTLTIQSASGSVLNNGTLNLNAPVTGAGNIINSATVSTGFTTTLAAANLDSSGTLDFNISPSSTGQLNLVTGSATLAGAINVDFLSGAFAAGDITLVSTSNALVIPGGVGSLSLTGTGIGGLSLAVSGDGTDLLLTGVTGPPGDFDGNLDVDGDDFLFWQRNLGDAPNLALWQANYGFGTLAAGVGAVPEPGSAMLLVCGMALMATKRSR